MVPRETLSEVVGPLTFRHAMQKAHARGIKDRSRRPITEKNSIVTPGNFAGLDLETGRARHRVAGKHAAHLRAQCTFESGNVRVVSVSPLVCKGMAFWEKGTSGANRWRRNSMRTLLVTDVDVARVQDMTDEDALAEGVVMLPRGYDDSPRSRFAWFWDSCYGCGAWDRNDWVWIYRYEVVRANVDDWLAQS